MIKLKFSSIQQPELVGYLALLKISESELNVEEIIGECEASLKTGDNDEITDRKRIAMTLAKLSSASGKISGPQNVEQVAKYEQVFSFAYGSIEPSCSTSHPDMFSVLEILNEMLTKTVFLVGNELSAADYIVFALLHSRIRALIPLNQAKYFRVIRWFLQVEHVTQVDPQILPQSAFDLKALEAEMNNEKGPVKEMEKMSLEEAKEKKKQKKQQQQQQGVDKSNNNTSSNANNNNNNPDIPVIARVDLRVGKIVEIEKHPNADRLYIEKVDFGEPELRTVVSGLVEHVPIDELRDRLCLFICNLKPASICKVQSTAMLLVAKNDTQGLEPLIIPPGARPGDKVSVAGVEPCPDAVIKPAKEPQTSVWDDVRKDLSVDAEGVAKYKDQALLINGINQPIHSSKITAGTIG